jgi:putative peptide zinc metalloprotease protein
VVAASGSWVKPGDVLIRCREPDLETEVRALEAQLHELDARYRSLWQEQRVKATLVLEQRRYVEEELVRARERSSELLIRSHAEGVFVLPQAENLRGRFIHKGQMVAHVVSRDMITVRSIIPQQDIDLVRKSTRQVLVRLIERRSDVEPANVSRIVPSASDQLPSPALGSQGGGQLALDPTDKEGRKAVQRFFQVDVRLPANGHPVHVGGRAYIRFDHGWTPLGWQWYRDARQLFLSRLNV